MGLSRKFRRAGEAQEMGSSRLNLSMVWPLMSVRGKVLKPIYSLCSSGPGVSPRTTGGFPVCSGEATTPGSSSPLLIDGNLYVRSLSHFAGVCVDNFEGWVLQHFPEFLSWDYVAVPHWGSWIIITYILVAFLSLDHFLLPHNVSDAPCHKLLALESFLRVYL